MEEKNCFLKGIKIIIPKVFGDERGWFYESFNREKFSGIGIDIDFAQDNHSMSIKGTLRGLHFQSYPGQAKLIRCTRGRIWDVAVDIRIGSPTLGQWFGMELSQDNQKMIFIPVGFAHGFLTLSDHAEVEYKCSSVYNPDTESGIQWDDKDINVKWPLKNQKPLLSKRDQSNQSFADFLKQSTS